MKKSVGSILLAFVFLMMVVSACAPAATPPPTSVPPTFTPHPTETVLSTNTPIPTATATQTPEPTATPIQIPDTLNSTFSNVEITYRDSFQYVINNVLPAGWECEEQYAGWITEDNHFKIHPSNGGTVCFFSQESIAPQKGIYFTFKYTGAIEAFTLGFDALKEDGERIEFGGAGFHSVAMQMENTVVSAHILREGWQNSSPFKGNLKLREDTWYEVALGLDDNNNYIIKIWQPEAPEQQITYLRKWDDFPDNYIFISWISAKRSLEIDDFTVFNFEEIAQQ